MCYVKQIFTAPYLENDEKNKKKKKTDSFNMLPSNPHF